MSNGDFPEFDEHPNGIGNGSWSRVGDDIVIPALPNPIELGELDEDSEEVDSAELLYFGDETDVVEPQITIAKVPVTGESPSCLRYYDPEPYPLFLPHPNPERLVVTQSLGDASFDTLYDCYSGDFSPISIFTLESAASERYDRLLGQIERTRTRWLKKAHVMIVEERFFKQRWNDRFAELEADADRYEAEFAKGATHLAQASQRLELEKVLTQRARADLETMQRYIAERGSPSRRGMGMIVGLAFAAGIAISTITPYIIGSLKPLSGEVYHSGTIATGGKGLGQVCVAITNEYAHHNNNIINQSPEEQVKAIADYDNWLNQEYPLKILFKATTICDEALGHKIRRTEFSDDISTRLLFAYDSNYRPEEVDLLIPRSVLAPLTSDQYSLQMESAPSTSPQTQLDNYMTINPQPIPYSASQPIIKRDKLSQPTIQPTAEPTMELTTKEQIELMRSLHSTKLEIK